jgi:hypothetical protein
MILGMQWTEAFMVLLGAAALVVEIIAKITNDNLVISVIMRNDGQRWSWEPFLFGLLPGHFYCPDLPWSMFGWSHRPSWFPLIWVAMAAALLVRDFFWPRRFPLVGSLVCVFLGFVGGAVFWNQG